MNRIKERTRRRAALGDRKSATAQARMKTIATLAADDRVPKKKTQRKNAGGMYQLRLDGMLGNNTFFKMICSGRTTLIGLSIVKSCVSDHGFTFFFWLILASIRTHPLLPPMKEKILLS